MSGNAGIVTADSGVIENMGIAAGISPISLFIPEIGEGSFFVPSREYSKSGQRQKVKHCNFMNRFISLW